MMICSTPKGKNLFTDLLQNAERKDGDPLKNKFVATRVNWWEVSGRDNDWKEKEIKNLGSKEMFDREYDLKF